MTAQESERIILTNLIAFLRGLRKLGFIVGVDEVRLVLEALVAVGVAEEELCRFAVQSVVVKHGEELPVFRAAWHQFWLSLTRGPHPWLANNTLWANVLQRRTERHRHPQVIWMGATNTTHSTDGARDTDDLAEVTVKTGASSLESMEHKDFAELTELERQQFMNAGPHRAMPRYLSQRWRPATRGARIDLSATLRKGMQQGEWVELIKGHREQKPRPVVFLCDVSGSMDPYSRMILRFIHLLARSGVPMETFTLGTNLYRITKTLKLRNVDEVLAQLSAQIPDLSGGTRIAKCLRAFNSEWSRRVLRHRAIVILATDGLDSGNDLDLKRQLAHLTRLASRVVWWNPNLRDPKFEPTARGTSVFYETVDEMWPASSWLHLEQFWQSCTAASR